MLMWTILYLQCKREHKKIFPASFFACKDKKDDEEAEKTVEEKEEEEQGENEEEETEQTCNQYREEEKSASVSYNLAATQLPGEPQLQVN